MKRGQLFGVMIGFVLAALAMTDARAQDTIVLYGDVGEGLSRYIDTPTGVTTFDIVVAMDPALGPSWVEFHINSPELLFPGVFMVAYEYPGHMSHTMSHTELGEYDIVLNWGAPCMESGYIEVARFTYLDMDGVIPDNTVIRLAPFGPESVTVPNCPGTICYGECETGTHLRPNLQLVPWTDLDVIDPTWIPGVASSDGVLVLNPDPIAVTGSVSSMGMLKARY